jgi:hypothetical protein
MQEARDNFSAVLLHDGKVLALGGQNQNQAILASCELYDAALGTWQSAASMATPRMHHAAVKLQDGRVLVAGGVAGQKSEVYDPYANAWSQAGDMQLPHGAGLAMVVLDDGKVLATGGEAYPTAAEIFDPITQTWSLLSYGTARKHYFHSMVRLKDGNFLIVGTQSEDLKDQFSAEIYNPLTMAFTKRATLLPMCRPPPWYCWTMGKYCFMAQETFTAPTTQNVSRSTILSMASGYSPGITLWAPGGQLPTGCPMAPCCWPAGCGKQKIALPAPACW